MIDESKMHWMMNDEGWEDTSTRVNEEGCWRSPMDTMDRKSWVSIFTLTLPVVRFCSVHYYSPLPLRTYYDIWYKGLNLGNIFSWGKIIFCMCDLISITARGPATQVLYHEYLMMFRSLKHFRPTDTDYWLTVRSQVCTYQSVQSFVN